MSTPSTKGNRLVLFLLLLSLVVGSLTVYRRYQVETGYTHYEIVLDYPALRSLAASSGMSLREVAVYLKEAGATGISLPVQTVSDLLAAGEAVFVPTGYELIQSNKAFGNWSRYELPEGTLMVPSSLNLPRDLSFLDFERTFAGPDPKALALAKEVGLAPVLRIPFFPRATKKEIERAFSELGDFAGRPVVFEGQKLLGYPQQLGEVQAKLAEYDLLLGDVEFSGQRGIDRLAEDSPQRLVRVHTITAEEMDLLSYDRALARWIRAVKERNIRVLYLYPFTPDSLALRVSNRSPLELTAEMIRDIRGQLVEAGYTAAPVKTLSPLKTSQLSFLAVTLGLLGATYLTARFLLVRWWQPWFGRTLWLLGLAAVLALNILFAWEYSILAGQITAFGAALVFPVLAVLLAARREQGLLSALGTAIGTTFIGVIVIVTALAQAPFLLKAEQFLGVKLMHLLPPLAVAFFLWSQGYFRTWSWNRLTLLALPVVVLAGGYLIVRTGNIGAVADWERELRDALEALLVVRPRTKEMLLGHPALVLGLWLQHTGRGSKVITGLALVAGTIGLLSILNTFTHVHTPLTVSAVRTLHGLWIGLGLGFLAVLVYDLVERLLLHSGGRFQ
ncbi:MAG: hypothetical protein H0Z38_07565 [Firmicutes bacterium]|nr:hypothetical protein [Bacillota bacterium]